MTTAAARPRRRFRWLRRLAAFCTLLVLLYLGRGWFLPPAARFLDVSEAPRRADYVLVLGGGVNTRPFVAAALIRTGLARRVLVPAVEPSPESQDGISPDEQELIRRVLLVRGVPAENIIALPGACASTLDEARALARLLDAEPDATVAVVTHGYHTRRARMLFRRVLGEKLSRVHFVAAPTDRFDPNNWWRTKQGFVTYTNEYAKLILYLFR